MKRFGLLSGALLAGSAFGQSINIDINAAGGAGGGAPSSAYGAAAAQPGHWNDIFALPDTLVGLKNLSGVNTSATIATGGEVVVSQFNGMDTGDCEKLMEDGWKTASVGSNLSMTFDIDHLQAGWYRIWVYADDPGDATTFARVTVAGTTYNVGGGRNGNALFTPVSHCKHIMQIDSNDSVFITVSNGTAVNGRGYVNGIQVEKLPERLYVKSNAAGAATGLDWTNAFPRLEDAFAAATSLGGSVSEIWVAAGTYYPDPDPVRADTFNVPSGVKIYGGFSGTETMLGQRNPAANFTYLSGSIDQPGTADNCYHVVTAWGCDGNTLLDGFSITGGNADSFNGWDYTGGGLYIRDSDIVIRDCTIFSNLGYWGAGATVDVGGWPRFENCYFYNNDADSVGGGLHVADGCAATVVNCRFRYCDADRGGGMDNRGGSVFLYNSVFQRNSGATGGGGLYCFGGSVTMMNTVFSANSSNGFYGGAVFCWGDPNDTTFLFGYNCTVYGNTATNTGGIASYSGSLVYLRNLIAWGNTDTNASTSVETEQMGKLSSGDGTLLSVFNCDVQGWSGALGGTGNFGADPEFIDPNGPNNFLGDDDDDLRLSFGSPCIDSGSNNSIPQDHGDVDGDGDTGEPTPLDLAGHPRRVDDLATPDTGSGTAPIVDIGAYEYTQVLGDMNCDGAANVLDINPFVLAIIDPAGYAAQFPDCSIDNGDINGDGDVNVLDINPMTNLLIGG
ncbi:hypothetical protein RAS1_21650 [Phycisphaerae bacterium RAS1]|nr:hypothetical protein RAS1_21650 [Phycisphaerae bacterium RAS1]